MCAYRRCAFGIGEEVAKKRNSFADCMSKHNKECKQNTHAHAPTILAHDRRVIDAPLEERLHSQTSDLISSVRDARA
jgi:hypothetical protein